MKTNNIFIIFLLVLFAFAINLYASPKIWIATEFDMSLNQSSLSQWRLNQSLSFPITGYFSLSALFGYSYYYESDTGYKLMIGGTFIFPKSWYIDFMYGFSFANTIDKHEILLNVNFEKNEWYLAFRQIFKFNNNFFSSISYIYSIYNFPSGYNFSVNSAIGYETDKGISYALWMKSYLAFFPIFGVDAGASFAIEQSLFNLSLILGFKFNFPIFSVGAYIQPYFFNKAGFLDIGLSLVVRL
ncbi:MAG TPA: hypothetical protein PLF21_03470 [Exilispira sp.]|nr:hypothetical protein [Exilispira sp.]